MSKFKFPPPGRQVYMAAFLARVRSNGGLHDAVRETARTVDAGVLRSQIIEHAPYDGLQLIQGSEVRDEEVFAVPVMLQATPGLVTYYRLLLGVSQKQFFTSKSGLNIFKPMEERQQITPDAEQALSTFCTELNNAMNTLLHALPVNELRQDVNHLPLLTLGAQADGSWRGQIGKTATREVFAAMKAIVREQGRYFSETDISITVVNNSNREVTLALAPDPDVVIREKVNDSLVYKVAIEIKGGQDYSNLHNRAGEAEKSHQKARADGAQDCWTVISLDRANLDVLRQESPSTREWIDISQVRAQKGDSWNRLVALTLSAMGI